MPPHKKVQMPFRESISILSAREAREDETLSRHMLKWDTQPSIYVYSRSLGRSLMFAAALPHGKLSINQFPMRFIHYDVDISDERPVIVVYSRNFRIRSIYCVRLLSHVLLIFCWICYISIFFVKKYSRYKIVSSKRSFFPDRFKICVIVKPNEKCKYISFVTTAYTKIPPRAAKTETTSIYTLYIYLK